MRDCRRRPTLASQGVYKGVRGGGRGAQIIIRGVGLLGPVAYDHIQRTDNVKAGRYSTFKSCVTPARNFLFPVSSVPTFPLTQQSTGFLGNPRKRRNG